VQLSFAPDDPDYPGASVDLKENIALNAVHRQRVYKMRVNRQHIVETVYLYAGDV
jgi:hypothetical protein